MADAPACKRGPDATASVKGGRLFVTAVNLSLTEAAECGIALTGAEARTRVLLQSR